VCGDVPYLRRPLTAHLVSGTPSLSGLRWQGANVSGCARPLRPLGAVVRSIEKVEALVHML